MLTPWPPACRRIQDFQLVTHRITPASLPNAKLALAGVGIASRPSRWLGLSQWVNGDILSIDGVMVFSLENGNLIQNGWLTSSWLSVLSVAVLIRPSRPIRSLLLNSAVLFLQEHWLSENQLQLLDNIDDCFLCTGVSGFDKSDELRGGHTAAVRCITDQIFFLQL